MECSSSPTRQGQEHGFKYYPNITDKDIHVMSDPNNNIGDVVNTKKTQNEDSTSKQLGSIDELGLDTSKPDKTLGSIYYAPDALMGPIPPVTPGINNLVQETSAGANNWDEDKVSFSNIPKFAFDPTWRNPNRKRWCFFHLRRV
jgi:hypothetical protein